MTSITVAAAVVRELHFGADAPAVAAGRAFAIDFDSSATWPDLPYDPASPAARHDAAARAQLTAVIDAAVAQLAARAPAAHAFVNTHLERALLRRWDAGQAAGSASNRACVGACLFTNLHLAPAPLDVAVEGLVHESIHQFLYRHERTEGNFCDLSPTPTLRSPWSGARLPLHSLVHASFVWFGLLTLWSRLAQSPASAAEAARSRDRIAHCLFGFAFLEDLIDGAAFPRTSADADVLAAIRGLGATARAAAQAAEGGATLAGLPALQRSPAWPAALAAGLQQVP